MNSTATTTTNPACALYAATLADSIATQLDVIAVDVQAQYRSVRDLAVCAANNRAAYVRAELRIELQDVDIYRDALAALRVDYCACASAIDCDCASDYDERARILSTRARSEINERVDVIARRLTTIEQMCTDATHSARAQSHYCERDALRAQ